MNQFESIVKGKWDQFLIVLFVLLGIGLFSSGLVVWIASNWHYLTKFEKMYGVQALLLGVICLNVWIYWRESAQPDRVPIKTMLIGFVVAVIIGGLFALMGQIYQTGADPWQLFALWAVLQLPLVIVLPNVANILLWIATVNLAIIFSFSNLYQSDNLLTLFCINLIFFIISEQKSFLPITDPWRILPRSLLVSCAVITTLISVVSFPFILIGVWGGILFFYHKVEDDILGYLLSVCILAFSLDFLLVMNLANDSSSVITACVNILAVILIGYKIYWWGKKYPDFHRYVGINLFYVFFGAIVVLTLLSMAFLLSRTSMDIEIFFMVSAILFYLIGIYFRWRKQAVVSAMAFTIGLLFVIYLDPSSDNILIKITLIFYVLAYGVSNVLWVETLSVMGILLYVGNLLGEWHYFNEILALSSLGIFYFLPKLPTKLAQFFRPIGWALFFYLFFQVGLASIKTFAEEKSFTEIATIADFLNVVSNGFVEKHIADWTFWLTLAQVLSPLVIFWRLNQKYGYSASRTKKRVLFIGVLLFCTAFVGSPWVLICFGLLLLAYYNRSQALFGLNLLLILFFLGYYYYWLGIPLLYKSFLLLSSGGILLLLAIYLYLGTHRAEQAVRSLPKFAKKSVPISLLFTLFSSLAIANYEIMQNEAILEKGSPIVLKLAPQDPRSLLQGDYMDLNYELLNQVQQTLPNQGVADSWVYALFTQQKNGVASLCRVAYQVPIDFTGCAEELYLPIRVDEYWKLSLPSSQFFFPEGRAEHYRQAKYGEYRVKGGRALLARLLDENLQPL